MVYQYISVFFEDKQRKHQHKSKIQRITMSYISTHEDRVPCRKKTDLMGMSYLVFFIYFCLFWFEVLNNCIYFVMLDVDFTLLTIICCDLIKFHPISFSLNFTLFTSASRIFFFFEKNILSNFKSFLPSTN